MRMLELAAMAVLALSPAAALAQEPLVTMVPLDSETTINGVGVACTGIGQTREDPRWQAYPVRIEVSDAQNAYLAGAVVQVRTQAGMPLLAAECDGPWLLVKLAKGRYLAEARVDGSPARPRSAPFAAPATGQVRVVLKFTDIDVPPAAVTSPASSSPPAR